ncbi:MAG: NAD(P)H-hydrate dehydratase [Acidithiobacillus sp.]
MVSTLHWPDLERPPRRPPAAHKGDFGHVFVVGGQRSMGGALALASLAAYRAGAGLVTAVGQAQSQIYLAAQLPEATWWDWPAHFRRLPANAVLAVGPGLGQGLASHDLVREIGTLSVPAVWDADALNILARLGPQLWSQPAERLATPHPGEAARLLQSTTVEVQKDRVGAIRALAARYGGTWILKGEGTLILGAMGLWRCPLGNPGMATGGSGDVLTGLCAGLMAQGLNAAQAAQLAVCVHARAGDLAARAQGEASVIATDILAYVPQALRELMA